MSHLAEQIAVEQCFAIEFEDKGPNRYMTVRYWEGQNLHRVLICRSQLPATEALLTFFAQLIIPPSSPGLCKVASASTN